MALRNVTKACLVLLLLLTLTSLVVIASPQPLVQAQAEERLKQASLATAKEAPQTAAEISLELRSKIDPRVLKQFSLLAMSRSPLDEAENADRAVKRSPEVRYIVHLTAKADLSRAASIGDLKQRRVSVVGTLRRTAEDSQAALRSYLEEQRASGKVTAFMSYWIFNGFAVTSDLETLLAVAARPEVEFIRPDRVHHLPPVTEGQHLPSALASIEWNIAQIGADRVWSAYGLRGEGIVVATLDSGVDWTHPALQPKYRGYDPVNPAQSRHDYNWLDATDTYPAAPGDGDGHGTHTMGTMVGSLPDGRNQVGVAPEARWIAAKVFNDEGDAYDSWIHAGFQWILAPTDLSGRNPDPTLAPDICSNSWGDSDSSDTTFWDDVSALRAAGIFSVFAVGNEYLESLAPHTPGAFPHAFAVGATDHNDVLAQWSCRGPSPWDEIKPEVTAPGVSVRSTSPGDRYAVLDGTSMATPHVAGVVALLWQAQRRYGAAADLNGPQWTITATEQVITSTAHPLPDASSVPNNDYGWGRVDAYQAVGSVAQGGAFWGRVADVATGNGISGAMITMLNRRFGGTAHAWTDGQGHYTFSVAAGIYDVTATHFYYAPQSVPAVEIVAGSTTQLDFQLTAVPTGRAVGRVTETGTGQPVSATVGSTEHSVQVATDRNGYYTMTLPLGHYALEVVPARAGHKISWATLEIEAEGQTVHQDFVLEVIPRILLVDADAWFTVGEIEYYRRSLGALLYSYDTWIVDDRSSSGIGNFPPSTTLRQYDVVVWSQPLASPGYIGAWSDLSDYLQAGKALLIAGQDIGYWDVEREHGADDYEDYLHARYIRDDSTVRAVAGLSGTFLADLTLTLNTADSAGNQEAPSEIAPTDAMATSILNYVNDGSAGLAVDDCRGYRVVYLAFGLEGAGPESARTETLRRTIEWLAEPRPDYAFSLATPSQQATGAPASDAVLDFALLNSGLQADAYVLTVEGNRWPAAIWDATHRRQITTTAILSPCSSVDLILGVEIPNAAVTGQTDSLTLRVQSTTAPAVSQARVVHVTASMPWKSLAPLPTPRYRLAAAAAGDCQFFVIGGWDAGGEASRANEMYDLRTGVWRTMAPKTTAAANTAAATIGGQIYVPGGMWGDTRLSALEIYDPDADRWTRGTDLPREMTGMAVSSAGGKLYIFGGNVDGGRLLSTTYEYDPAAEVWSERASLPSGPRAYAAATELDGKIYVAGGWPALSTFECYDPATDSWISLAPMPTGRQSLSLVAVDGYIYAVGGGNVWMGLPAVERYDPGTDSWVAMSSLSSSLTAGSAAVTVAGRIFAAGGADEDAGIGAAHETLAVGTSLGDSSLTGRETVAAGDRLTYVITLRNPGQQAIPQAVLRDPIPSHTVYIQDSVVGDATYNPSARRIEWQGAMPPGSSREFGFQVAVMEDLPRGTTITNTVVLDDGLCGEQMLDVITLFEAPDLSQSRKLVDKPVAGSGDELTYLIELKNTGAVTATSTTLVDPIPEYLTYVAGSVEGATYNPVLNQIEWTGTLLPGGEGSYRWADSDSGDVEFDWVDATDDGTSVPGGGDDASLGPFDIGFPFTFYDTDYTEFYLNTNGQLLFGARSSTYRNVGIPNSDAPNSFIAPFWDDLVSEEGTMYYQLLGSAPDRRLVVEWADVRRFAGDSSLTFEVILYEGSNRILVQYHTLSGSSADGESATVGIEDEGGVEGIEYQYNGEGPGYPLHAGLAVLFEPQPRHHITFQAGIALDAPWKTWITNEALLILNDEPPIPLTATTRVDWVDLPLSRKLVDKPVAGSSDELNYLIELSNVSAVTITHASLVDPIPEYLTYVAGSVEGATYNPDLNRIEWSGTLLPGGEGSYRWADSDSGDVEFDWVDATDGGTSVPGGGDDRSLGPFDIGFPFTFYDTGYTEFYLNTNGQLLFGAGSSALSNVRIPNSDAPNSFIAPFWDDLVSEEGTMYYQLLGSAPDRRLVVEWADVRRFAGDSSLTFEVILYEGSNRILVQYHTLNGSSADGESATAGIEDEDGVEGIEYQYNGEGPGYPLHAGLAVLFEPLAGQRITFRAHVAPDVPLNTLVVNEALLTVNEQPPFPITATTWINRIDLSNSKLAVDKTEARPGERLVYTMLLSNSGNVSATDASLIDPVPAGTSYVDGSATGGAVYNDLEKRIEWHGTVPAQSSVPISFSVATMPHALHNTVVANTASFDDGVGNVVTRTVVTVLKTHDLSTSDKTMPASARPGDVLTCTIRLRNTGVVSTAAILTDVIPTGATLIPASLWSSSGEAGVDAGTVTWHGEIIATGMVIVRFEMQVDQALQAGARLSNTALIHDQSGNVYERSANTMIFSAMYARTLYLPLIAAHAQRPGLQP